MPPLGARAAADPAPLEGRLAGGARAWSDTVAVADHVGRGAETRSWVLWRRGRVPIRTGEATGVSIDARRHAMSRVIAI